MSASRISGELCPSTSVALDIINRRRWTARRISNNNLRQHCRLLGRTFREDHPLTDPLRTPCRRLVHAIIGNSGLLTGSHPKDFPVVPVLVRVAAYSHRWIRGPESWTGTPDSSPREITRSLIEHLFARWTMPDFLDSAWQVKGALLWLERDWYCDIAAGASFRNLPGMPPTITSRALHLAQNAPANLGIRAALRWGQLKALNGSDELVAAVMASRMVNDLSNDTIWSRLFEKVAAATNFDSSDFGIIADTLLESNSVDDIQRAGWLVDLPLADLSRHCQRHWRSHFLAAAKNFSDWKGTDIRCPNLRSELIHRTATRWRPLAGRVPYVVRKDGGEWRIEELTNQWQLSAEGRMMHHCVGSYGRSCRSERNAIFSLRPDRTADNGVPPKSVLTIQVRRETRKIVQVRGKWNASPAPELVPVLRQWATALDLVI